MWPIDEIANGAGAAINVVGQTVGGALEAGGEAVKAAGHVIAGAVQAGGEVINTSGQAVGGALNVSGAAMNMTGQAVGNVASALGDAAVTGSGAVAGVSGAVAHSLNQLHQDLRGLLGKTEPERTVFVVYGREFGAWHAMRDFLRSLGLSPLNYSDLESSPKLSSSYSVQDVLRLAFREANAVVVLFTPDEHVGLHPDLHVDDDRIHTDGTNRHQSRPNVFFEAGIAFALHHDRTVLVTFAHTSLLSDLRGVEPIAFTRDDVETRQKLVARLKAARVVVHEPETQEHLRPGSFQAVLDRIAQRKPA